MRSIGRLPFVARLLAYTVLFSLLLVPYRSAQAGADAWTSTGPPDNIGTVAVAASNNQIIYAIGQQGLWKSLDGGTNWSTVGNVKLDLSAPLAIAPSNAAIAYSREPQFSGGIIKSLDGGMSWTTIRPNANVMSVAVDRTRPNTVYAGLGTEILKSSNGGITWGSVYGPFPQTPGLPSVIDIVIQPDHPDTVYAAFQGYHGGHVERSVDVGTHWNTADSGGQVGPAVPTALAVGPGPGFGPVYVGWGLMGFKVLRKSDDGGATWQDLTSSLPSGGGNIASLSTPGNATTIIASINGISGQTKEPGGVYVSLDGGQSWDQPAPSPENVGKLAWAPTTRTLYVATRNGVWQYTVPETGFKKTVNPRFQDYYDAHDGLRILGAPISIGTVVGRNLAQYFEKGRIEDHTGESPDPNWQFMYGLLVDEMQQAGAKVPVGGDTSTVSYATIKDQAAEKFRVAPPPGFAGGTMPQPDGSVFVPFTADLSPAAGHNVFGPFWDYVNRADLFPGGWLHDVGLPITEPMAAVVDKGNVTGRQITIQAFQRTILTYDPLNPPEWQVERANVGTDYQNAFPGKVPN